MGMTMMFTVYFIFPVPVHPLLPYLLSSYYNFLVPLHMLSVCPSTFRATISAVVLDLLFYTSMLASLSNPEDGGRRFLQSISNALLDYVASQHRRQ
jgi:hypothetical protein